MSGVTDLAEWLGIEVVQEGGEHWVRQRLNAHGKWFRRDTRATSAERKLYDVVRGLVYTTGQDVALAPLHRVARVLGVPPTPDLRLVDILEKLAGLLADNRHWREKAVGCDAELVRCRAEIQELKARLLDSTRLTPKGGTRGDTAQRAREEAYDEVRHAVAALRSVRWAHHPHDRSAYLRNEGEQNAFGMVVSLLEGNSVEGLEL